MPEQFAACALDKGLGASGVASPEQESGQYGFLTDSCQELLNPELHPVQGDDRQDLWNAICDSGWNRLYEEGVTLPTLTLPGSDVFFEHFIGMDCPPPNWNEGLDQELTKDLHLNSAFHHLFDHMEFAITDFIYVRKFETEIHIEIDKSL